MDDKKQVSLVLEGGGMRSFYTGGVLDAFLDENIHINYVIGVSAGAGNAVSYISKQKGRNLEIVDKYACDHRYTSKRNFIKHGSMIGMDFVFGEVPRNLIPFDWESFQKSNVVFKTGAFDCDSGETIWYGNHHYDEYLKVLRASCSLPFICKMVEYENRKLLDGGLRYAIPIEKSIEDGNDFHIIVLTRNEDYRKKQSKTKMQRIIYKKYPKLVEVLENRSDEYNRQLELCEKLQKDGKAIIIRPQKPIEVSRLERNKQKVIDLYNDGYKDALDKIDTIKKEIFDEFR